MANRYDIVLDKAYDKLNKKVFKSDLYYKFITSLSDLNEFKEIFTYDEKFNTKGAEEALKNLDNLRFICNNETGLKKEYEFHKMIISCVTNEDVISNIINTFLMETKYGNPDREKMDDYTLNDRMFYILQSVFELDTLVESVTNKKVLFDKFKVVTNDPEGKEAENFISLIDEMYREAKMFDDPEEMKRYISSRKDDIKPYVLAGLKLQLSNVYNSYNKQFTKYDHLYEIVNEIFDNSKKM